VKEQTVPPTVNWRSSFDGCGLDLAAAPRSKPLRNVVCGAFTVGGQSAAVVLRRCEG